MAAENVLPRWLGFKISMQGDSECSSRELDGELPPNHAVGITLNCYAEESYSRSQGGICTSTHLRAVPPEASRSKATKEGAKERSNTNTTRLTGML